DRGDVGGDVVAGEDLARLDLAGRIADHGGAATDDDDRAVTAALERAHRHDLDEVADVQRGGGRVVADVEGDRAGDHGGVDGGEVAGLLEVAAPQHVLERGRTGRLRRGR